MDNQEIQSYDYDMVSQNTNTIRGFFNKKRIIAIFIIIFALTLVSIITIARLGSSKNLSLIASTGTLSNGAKPIEDPAAATGTAVLLPNIPAPQGATAQTVVSSLPQVASSTPIYMSGTQQAPPSNRWFSALAFFHDHNMASFAHPLALKTTSNGFSLSATRVVGTINTVYGSATPDVNVSFSQPTWNFVNRYDDMMVVTDFKAGSTTLGALTLTHGSPYAYLTLPNGGVAAVAGDSLKKLKDNSYSFSTGGSQYIVVWDTAAVTGTEESGRVSFKATKADGLITIATIPAGSSVDAVYEVALNKITGTEVQASRSGETWNTTFTVSTNNGKPTLFGLLPNEAKGVQNAGASVGSFDTLYGKMAVFKGNQFTSSSAVKVPASSYDIASFTEQQKQALIPLVKADIAALSFPAPDTYFDGKALAKGATLFDMAKQLGLEADAKIAHDKVVAEFALWFDPKGCETRSLKCFLYDTNLKGVVGKQYAFGNEEMNDHHFHYGYWLAAAANIAKYDKSFITTYGAYLDMLATDYSNTDRSNAIAPYVRGYDLYLGHSWAAGLSPFADGNNQESSSEGVNAHYGLYQWASVRGNTTLASTALWLYNRETAASTAYWTNIDKTIKGYDKFTAPFVSMVWGGKRDYATWFSSAGEAKLAIQVLPLTPASTYLGYDKARVKSNLDAAAPSPNSFKDILVGYLALSDPAAAQTRLNGLSGADIDDGNTKSNLQAFIYFAQAQSAASKKPLQPGEACSVNVTSASAATYSITVDEATTYRTWVRMSGTEGNPSVAVQIDNDCPRIMSADTKAYSWVGASAGQASTTALSKGNHTVTVFGLTKGTRIDRILLSKDVACTPSDSVGSCQSGVPPVVPPTTPTTTTPTSGTTTPSADTTPVTQPAPNPQPLPATPTPTATGAPESLHVVGSTNNSVTIAWNGDQSKSYEVLRAGVRIATITGLSFTDKGLMANTPYLYSVRGANVTTPQIKILVSPVGVAVTTAPTAPISSSTTSGVGPSNLSVGSKTSSTITLTWSGDKAKSYDVLRSGIRIATVTGTSFTDIGLLVNTPYIYSIRSGTVTTPQITVTLP